MAQCPDCHEELPITDVINYCDLCGFQIHRTSQIMPANNLVTEWIPLVKPESARNQRSGDKSSSAQNQICPACGAQYPTSYHYCEHCGSKLS